MHREPEVGPASPFVLAHAERLRVAAARGPILDLACGRGRHAIALAGGGVRVVGLDRDAGALRELDALARARGLAIAAVRADAEAGCGLPFPPACFAGVVVSRFLFRPLAPALASLLRPGGVLLYETFTHRQNELGHGPRNPAFLLDPGELPRLFPGLAVLEYREHCTPGPRPEWLASLAARKPS